MDCSPPGSSTHGDSPDKNTGVDCHALLQGTFPTWGRNPGLLHCRWILYHLSHQGSPRILEWVAYPSPGDLTKPGIETGSNALQADSLPAELQGSPIFALSSVQSLSRVRLFATPWIAARQASLSITNSQSLLRLTSIESVMPSSCLILCHPLLLLLPIPLSIRVFSNESTFCLRWPKYWSFSFSIIPSKEIPGLISFRMDWLDLLAVQGTLKSFLQHHSSKALSFLM